MGCTESVSGGLVPGVKYSSVNEHYPDTLQFPVTVGMGSAAHSRGVVHHDSSYHTASDGGRIRTEFSSEWFQYGIHPRSYDSRFKRDFGGIIGDLVPLPILAGDNKYRVADRLARETGPGRTECDRDIKFRCSFKNLRDLFLARRTDDNLRHKPVKTRVRTPGETPQFVCVDSAVLHETTHRLEKTRVFFFHIQVRYTTM